MERIDDFAGGDSADTILLTDASIAIYILAPYHHPAFTETSITENWKKLL